MAFDEYVATRAREVARAVVTSFVEQGAAQGGDELLRFVDGEPPAGPLVDWVTLLEDDLPDDPYFGPTLVGYIGIIASLAVLSFAHSAGITREQALQAVIKPLINEAE